MDHVPPENTELTPERLQQIAGWFSGIGRYRQGKTDTVEAQAKAAWQKAIQELGGEEVRKELEKYLADNKQVIATTEDVEKIERQLSDQQILEIARQVYTNFKPEEFAGGEDGCVNFLRWAISKISHRPGLGSLEFDPESNSYQVHYVGRRTENEDGQAFNRVNIDPAAIKGLDDFLDRFQEIGAMLDRSDKAYSDNPNVTYSRRQAGLDSREQTLARLLNQKGFSINPKRPSENILYCLYHRADELEAIFQKAKEKEAA